MQKHTVNGQSTPKLTVETNGQMDRQTDGWTEPITLPSLLTRSLDTDSEVIYAWFHLLDIFMLHLQLSGNYRNSIHNI